MHEKTESVRKICTSESQNVPKLTDKTFLTSFFTKDYCSGFKWMFTGQIPHWLYFYYYYYYIDSFLEWSGTMVHIWSQRTTCESYPLIPPCASWGSNSGETWQEFLPTVPTDQPSILETLRNNRLVFTDLSIFCHIPSTFYKSILGTTGKHAFVVWESTWISISLCLNLKSQIHLPCLGMQHDVRLQS